MEIDRWHANADFLAHVIAAHGLAEADVKAATGKMQCHMDATHWYQSDYGFDLPDGRALVLRQMRHPRSKADQAYWSGE